MAIPTRNQSKKEYEYLNDLPADGWAWEFLRRNEFYRKAYEEIRKSFSELKEGKLHPLEDGHSAGIVGELWLIQAKFNIKPFYSNKPYGAGIPDPSLPYHRVPDEIKPLMERVTFSGQFRPPYPIRSFLGKKWDVQLKRKSDLKGIRDLWDMDPEIAVKSLLHQILSPDEVENSIFIGVSIKAKREEARDQIDLLLKKHLEPTSSKGKPRDRKREWETYLEVWDEWEKRELPVRKSFREIASKLGIVIGTVKTDWYKAYKLIYGTTYDPRKIKEETRGNALKLCAKCSTQECYKRPEWIPCPKYLKVAGKGYLRALLKPDESLEYLSQQSEEEGVRRVKPAPGGGYGEEYFKGRKH